MGTLPLFVNQWQTWVIILVVVLVLFGATRLPALSRSLGQSIRIFRKEVKDGSAEAETETETDEGSKADAKSSGSDKE